MEPKQPVTFATKLVKFGTLVSIVGAVFVWFVEDLALNDDCNPCGYYLALWIFYPLILGLGMIVIGLVVHQRHRTKP